MNKPVMAIVGGIVVLSGIYLLMQSPDRDTAVSSVAPPQMPTELQSRQHSSAAVDLTRFRLHSTFMQEEPPRSLIEIKAVRRLESLYKHDLLEEFIVTCVEIDRVCLGLDDDTYSLFIKDSESVAKEIGKLAESTEILSKVNYEHLYQSVADSLLDPDNPAVGLMVGNNAILVTENLYDYGMIQKGDQILSINHATILDLAGKGPMGSTLAIGSLRLEIKRGSGKLIQNLKRDPAEYQ